VPTYQYACTACEDRLEAVQKFSDDPLTECPSCHGRLRKVYSSVGVVFKGSGFYRTDSRADSRKAADGAGERGQADKKEPAKKSTESGAKDSSGGKDSSSSGSSSSTSSGRSSERSGGSGKSSSGGSREKVA
jgi:putative FmdB family regulatory protein